MATELKGRHLGFLLLLCSTWTAMRIAVHWSPDVAAPAILAASDPDLRQRISARKMRPVSGPVIRVRKQPCCEIAAWTGSTLRAPPLERRRWSGKPQSAGTYTFAEFAMPPANVIVAPASPEPLAEFVTRSQPATARRKLALNGYAYSFWRQGAPGSGLAGEQYGGGQSGLIVTTTLPDSNYRNLALLVRAAVAHDDIRDRDLAFGIRWQPKVDLPVSVTLERRIRNAGSDNFAVYLAGGLNNVKLVHRFKLETYAQAGVVSGKNAGHFFDLQARADRPLSNRLQLPVFLGAGVWAGGQRDILRVDIGPSLRTELPLGGTRVRVTADWRVRVAGDAAPGNGPALTLSTGF